MPNTPKLHPEEVRQHDVVQFEGHMYRVRSVTMFAGGYLIETTRGTKFFVTSTERVEVPPPADNTFAYID